jgi:hypothetical protein
MADLTLSALVPVPTTLVRFCGGPFDGVAIAVPLGDAQEVELPHEKGGSDLYAVAGVVVVDLPVAEQAGRRLRMAAVRLAWRGVLGWREISSQPFPMPPPGASLEERLRPLVRDFLDTYFRTLTAAQQERASRFSVEQRGLDEDLAIALEAFLLGGRDGRSPAPACSGWLNRRVSVLRTRPAAAEGWTVRMVVEGFPGSGA